MVMMWLLEAIWLTYGNDLVAVINLTDLWQWCGCCKQSDCRPTPACWPSPCWQKQGAPSWRRRRIPSDESLAAAQERSGRSSRMEHHHGSLSALLSASTVLSTGGCLCWPCPATTDTPAHIIICSDFHRCVDLALPWLTHLYTPRLVLPWPTHLHTPSSVVLSTGVLTLSCHDQHTCTHHHL